jgi:hypothetical protein
MNKNNKYTHIYALCKCFPEEKEWSIKFTKVFLFNAWTRVRKNKQRGCFNVDRLLSSCRKTNAKRLLLFIRRSRNIRAMILYIRDVAYCMYFARDNGKNRKELRFERIGGITARKSRRHVCTRQNFYGVRA